MLWVAEARVLTELGRRPEAVAALSKALELDPNNAPATEQLRRIQSAR
jgi:Flp pilus assembly protein TadD